MEAGKGYDPQRLYDVIVVGGGPAGLTAALYLARAKYRVLVLEKEQFGGQITITHEVVNYPGIGRTSGKEMTETMRMQGESFGAEFLLAEASALEFDGDVKTIKTDKGEFYCLGVLIATGAHPRSVGFTGEAEHKGRGVAYCATCDGEFFTGREIFVIGGGYAAAEESVFLTKFARHVTILIRGDDFTCAAAVAEPARKHKNITVLTNTVAEEVSGEGGLEYIRYRNTKTGKVTEYRADAGDFFGVFVLAGYVPDTGIVKGIVQLDDHGYIVTDAAQRTSANGVYAAGDVCIKPLRQVVTATGDGALAATELERYVAAVQRKTGIYAQMPAAREARESLPHRTLESHSPSDELLSEDMKGQLRALFEKMQGEAVLRLYLDKRDVSQELEGYMRALALLTSKLKVEIAKEDASSDFAPCVQICRADGTPTGLAFHGVPGGHEFSSFVLGIYNAIGPGQPIDAQHRARIQAISKPTHLTVLVSLSCTMCPDTVVAAQRIAACSEHVTAEVYDIHRFEELRTRHGVMSVPCILINDGNASFGKKNIDGVLALIE